MEYNDYDILMVLSLYELPVPLYEVLAQLTPGGPSAEDYADGLWLVAALEQDGLLYTNGRDEALAVCLTHKGRDLCQHTADKVATSLAEQWRGMQQLFAV